MKLTCLRFVLLAAPLAVTACIAGTPGDTGVVMAPLSPSPSTGLASPTPSPTATGTGLPAGVFFRDDFDGDRLDPARWTVHEREGRVLVHDGKLEMLVGGTSTTFPLVLPTGANLPKEGPFYVEARYEFLTAGKVAGFNLDYLPPSGPDDPGITEPFMRWSLYQNRTNFLFRNENRLEGAVAPNDSQTLKVPRRFRLEFDGTSNYRVIYDDLELRTFQSRRRPTHLWFGLYPNQPGKPAGWATVTFDSVESGVLVTPAAAEPWPTPGPAATASPAPAATEAPSLESPSPSPTASPAS